VYLRDAARIESVTQVENKDFAVNESILKALSGIEGCLKV